MKNKNSEFHTEFTESTEFRISNVRMAGSHISVVSVNSV